MVENGELQCPPDTLSVPLHSQDGHLVICTSVHCNTVGNVM